MRARLATAVSALGCLLMTAGAPEAAPLLTLHATDGTTRTGARLQVVVTNSGPAPMPLTLALRYAGGLYYPEFLVRLVPPTGGAPFEITPVGATYATQPVGCILPPGGTVTVPLDLGPFLAAFALPQAVYRVSVRYDTLRGTAFVLDPDLCGRPVPEEQMLVNGWRGVAESDTITMTLP